MCKGLATPREFAYEPATVVLLPQVTGFLFYCSQKVVKNGFNLLSSYDKIVNNLSSKFSNVCLFLSISSIGEVWWKEFICVSSSSSSTFSMPTKCIAAAISPAFTSCSKTSLQELTAASISSFTVRLLIKFQSLKSVHLSPDELPE